MKSKKRWSRQCVCLVIAALLGVFIWWNNGALSVSYTTVEADVNEEFRILHLSDLHSAWFGREQSRIVRRAENIEPDVIVFTGDMIDERYDERAAVCLIEKMAELAPVYCVTGNHEELERRTGKGGYERLIEAIERTENAYLLRGETVQLTDDLTLTGADDLSFAGWMSKYPAYLEELGSAAEGFSILLAHRPEMFDLYAEAGFELTLAGHAHGGQIRLPVLGGLFAPGQGILPELDSGLYEDENGAMIYVNRGLGNSGFPLRVFNWPELAVIDIK